MSLTPGTSLGPYEIVAPIGKGGMGEVYKARDTRLDRTVAIKVLPEHLAESPERKARFEREAKAISQLSHPHICTLYDVGEQDGLDYLVMEYIEGETLSDRLKKGALKLHQALEYGAQIADGLNKAHRAGIVHRDLKPGNIILTQSGAKLLDFGLARLAGSGNEDSEALSSLPTEAKSLTAEGSIVGTFQYMAPEQLEGHDVDARTDIFALGAVLYEMLTGKKAFEGKSQASLIAAILEHQPPPIGELQPLTPPLLERIVRRCLEKDPEDRWQSARDLEIELRSLGDESPDAWETTRPRAHYSWAAGGLIIGALLAGAVFWNSGDVAPTPAPVSRFSINLPGGRISLRGLAVSPDGRTLVFGAEEEGVQRLYRRSMEDPEVAAMSGTEGGRAPFFSPDGQWVAFWASGEMRKIPLMGGTPVTITQSSVVPFGAAWSSDDEIIFGSLGSPLQIVSANGGAPRALTELAENELHHGGPVLVAGDSAVLFWAGDYEASHIAVKKMGEAGHRTLLQGGDPDYSPAGHLLFARQNRLWAAPFDVDRLSVAGTEVPLEEGPPFVLTSDGTLIYTLVNETEARSVMTWVDRAGNSSPFAEDKWFRYPRISPDGRWVVVNSGADAGDLWIFDVERGRRSRLTSIGDSNHPLWTPDGKSVVFAGPGSGGGYDLFSQAVEGGTARAIDSRPGVESPTGWSPDGKILSFLNQSAGASHDIWLLPDDGEAKPLFATPFAEQALRFSPDGNWIAYVSNESGRAEVYVQSFPKLGRKYPISTNGGAEPVWSRDGRELFYREQTRMMSVRVRMEPDFFAADPEFLFEGRYDPGGFSGNANYDVSLDGERFLMVGSSEEGGAAASHLFIAINWLQELERLVPAGN